MLLRRAGLSASAGLSCFSFLRPQETIAHTHTTYVTYYSLFTLSISACKLGKQTLLFLDTFAYHHYSQTNFVSMD